MSTKPERAAVKRYRERYWLYRVVNVGKPNTAIYQYRAKDLDPIPVARWRVKINKSVDYPHLVNDFIFARAFWPYSAEDLKVNWVFGGPTRKVGLGVEGFQEDNQKAGIKDINKKIMAG